MSATHNLGRLTVFLFDLRRLVDMCSSGLHYSCIKIAETVAAMSVNEKKWLVMHMHVQLKLDELPGPPKPWLFGVATNC
jgi:hypothetical protein